MKIVKYVFLLIFLVVVAITVFIATQEGKYDIKKERVIKVPRTVLYNYINDYRNWENVGILTGNDTTAIFAYSQKLSGPGAAMSWTKGSSEGRIETVRLHENDSILQKATIDDLDSEIAWGFKDTLAGTKVTVRYKGELTFTEKAYAVLKGGVENNIEETLEKGLSSLNTFLVHELSIFDIKINEALITKTGKSYLGHAVTTKIADIGKKTSEILPKLLNFAKENKIAMNGMPFLLYKKMDIQQGTASYLICIPLKTAIFTAPGSEFEGGEITPFKALKVTLRGDYSHLTKAWAAARRHILVNGLQENTTGQYLEIYTKGIQQTKKPSGWITDIYIPIGPPTVAPVETLPAPSIPGTVAAPAARPVSTSAARPVARPTQTTGVPQPNRPAQTAVQNP